MVHSKVFSFQISDNHHIIVKVNMLYRMKMFFLQSTTLLFLLIKGIQSKDINTALDGIDLYLKGQPCYSLSGPKITDELNGRGFYYSHDSLDTINRPLELCGHICCDHLVVTINSFNDINPLWNQFHMYIFINMNERENPMQFISNIQQMNVIIFQRKGRFFGVYEKKGEEMVIISVWDGQKFWTDPTRNLKGEIFRVGSSRLPLFTDVGTLPDGSVHVGDGLENIFMRAITKSDDMELKYVDVLAYGNEMWGWGLQNGSFTGNGVSLVMTM